MIRKNLLNAAFLALLLCLAGWLFATAEKEKGDMPELRAVQYSSVSFPDFLDLARSKKLDDTNYGMVIGYTRALDSYGEEGWILDSTYFEKNVLIILFRRHLSKGEQDATYDVQYMLQTPPFMEERTNKALRELTAEGELFVSKEDLKKLRERARILALQKLGTDGWYRYRAGFIDALETFSISHVFIRLVEDK